jgi:hypothetical protein
MLKNKWLENNTTMCQFREEDYLSGVQGWSDTNGTADTDDTEYFARVQSSRSCIAKIGLGAMSPPED